MPCWPCKFCPLCFNIMNSLLFKISMAFVTDNFSDLKKIILSKRCSECQTPDEITKQDILKKNYSERSFNRGNKFFS